MHRRGATRHLHSFPTRRSSDLSIARAITEQGRANGISVLPAMEIRAHPGAGVTGQIDGVLCAGVGPNFQDRKSTRLNSSHTVISYAVFCLKKKIPLCYATRRST